MQKKLLPYIMGLIVIMVIAVIGDLYGGTLFKAISNNLAIIVPYITIMYYLHTYNESISKHNIPVILVRRRNLDIDYNSGYANSEYDSSNQQLRLKLILYNGGNTFAWFDDNALTLSINNEKVNDCQNAFDMDVLTANRYTTVEIVEDIENWIRKKLMCN